MDTRNRLEFGTAGAENSRGIIEIDSHSQSPSQSPGQFSGQGEAAATVIDARPAALVDGKGVAWGELRPVLNELAGAEALHEVILDRKLGAAAVEAGLVITPDDLAGERRLLLESLSDDPNVAIRLLDELRERQNLGKTRFEALLRRNAIMRRLIGPQVRISDDALRDMHEIVHGPKRQARIMVLPDLAAAQAAINLVNSGVSFADVAVEVSTDSSAARGGLLEPISERDPAYPEALRQTMYTLNPGEMSGPVLIEDQYAVVMLVKRIASDGIAFSEARPSLERMVRINQERLLMDEFARRLLRDTAVTIFDAELNESWERRKRGGG